MTKDKRQEMGPVSFLKNKSDKTNYNLGFSDFVVDDVSSTSYINNFFTLFTYYPYACEQFKSKLESLCDFFINVIVSFI